MYKLHLLVAFGNPFSSQPIPSHPHRWVQPSPPVNGYPPSLSRCPNRSLKLALLTSVNILVAHTRGRRPSVLEAVERSGTAEITGGLSKLTKSSRLFPYVWGSSDISHHHLGIWDFTLCMKFMMWTLKFTCELVHSREFPPHASANLKGVISVTPNL